MKDKIEIINLVPKFLNFFEEGISANYDINEAYLCWKKEYGFSALPPGGDREKIELSMFKDAYSKYHSKIEMFTNFAPNEEYIQDLLRNVKRLLGFDEEIEISIIYFIGFFEGNAFVAPNAKGVITLCLPLENEWSSIYEDAVITHEFIHIVHSYTSGLTSSWNRPLSQLIFQEGLAMKGTEYLVPGLESYEYITDDLSWLENCNENWRTIIDNIFDYLDKDDTDTLYKFTMGEGSSGNTREAYYIAWIVLERIFKNNITFKNLAELKDYEMSSFIKEHLL